MNKTDKEKIKKVRREEKYSYRMAKMMDRYGIPEINKWVTDNPNTLTRLSYEVYLEEERNIKIRRIWAMSLLALAIVLMITSFFIRELFATAALVLFVGSDMATNVRIDGLEQRRWRDMVYSMYRSEKEEKNEK